MHPHYLDLGGSGPLIHLATANGFPPETYRPLAAALAPRHRVVGYRARPLRPGARHEELASWRELAAEMLADSAALGPAPLVAMGHSLGGIMSLYAALWRPERFRAIVLIDPVLLQRRLLPLVWAARKLGRQHRMPLARGAARRRDRFSSVEEARQRYTGRGAFAGFVPDALEAYLQSGLRPDGDGLTLAWPRAWESRIFALVPIDTWDAVARLRVPLLLIRGSHSDLITDESWRELRRNLPRARLVEVEGGHMVPMERPAEVAAAVEQFLVDLPPGYR